VLDALPSSDDHAPIPTDAGESLLQLSFRWAGLRAKWEAKAKGLDEILTKLRECGVEPEDAEFPKLPAEDFDEALDDADAAAGFKIPIRNLVNPLGGLMVTTTLSEDQKDSTPPDVPGLDDEDETGDKTEDGTDEKTEEVMPASDSPAQLETPGDALIGGGLYGRVPLSPDRIAQSIAGDEEPTPGDARTAGGLFGNDVELSDEAGLEALLGESATRPPGTPLPDVDPNADYDTEPKPSFGPQGPPPDDGVVM
jgi:hypothetical protein